MADSRTAPEKGESQAPDAPPGVYLNSYSAYLRRRWGRRIYRVGVDPGFDCPHSAGGGCSYCDRFRSRPAWLRNPAHSAAPGPARQERLARIKSQVEAGREFLGRRYGAEGFILYFQAGTNTAADPGELKAAWDYGLSLGDFCGLAVATRPDCLSPAALDLLASYQTPGREVVVELGLQSAGDATLRRINRGHSRDDFARGWEALSRRGIPGVIHLILGLPGEGWAEMEETARWTAALRPFGVKLHNLHIPRLSPLFEEFLRGEATAPSPPRYLEALIRVLERLPPETLILRLTADTPGGPAAPRRFWDKSRLDRELKARMEDRKTWQGRLCPEGPKILSKEIE